MIPRSPHIAFARAARRRAGVLVEFIVAFFLLYLIIGIIIAGGHMMFSAQSVNAAVDAAARELARTPLPPAVTFEEVRDASAPPTDFSTRVYSEDWLVIDITPWTLSPGGMTLYEYVDSLGVPMVNKMLLPVMTVQRAGSRTLLRYPGALVTSPTAPSGLTVEVPVVISQDNDGSTTIRWVRVLEEVDTEDQPGDNTGTSPDPFSVLSAEGGVAALRLNLPYQSFLFSEGSNFFVVTADDSQVTELNSPSGTPVDPGQIAGTFAGEYGLGSQEAYGGKIRPWRRVVSTQAIYRREVFE